MRNIMMASVILSLANSSYAAGSIPLKVEGKILTASCTPTFSNGGVIDYGNIVASTLNPTSATKLETKNITLTINCVSPTKVGFSSNDDRQDSDAALYNINVDPAYNFGLGKTATGVNIGSYAVQLNNSAVTADGVNANLIYIQKDNFSNPDRSWTDCGGFYAQSLQQDNWRIMTVGTGLDPIAFTTAEFPMGVTAGIQATDTLGLIDNTPIDGQLTFSLIYL
ncbi:DUF1120 domain-containing protein [Buttiauxella sp. 3AFRM03]|nr:DUF1120 domain-containing protein [Buttiauxella sp. 3AFRM03]TDN51096.1 uncharacterized protein DUF1120 [Buttiauxella sp. JUb87]